MTPRRGRQTGRWLVAGIFVGIAAVLVLLDWRFKSSDAAGFVPDGVTWRVYSDDLPTFWGMLQENALWQRTRPDLLPIVRRVELELTRVAGIRPTPGRLDLWLGSKALIGGIGDDVGVSVRPGVLLRVALAMVSWGSSESAEGAHRYRDMYWAWREGFLILSRSRTYVESALASPDALRLEGASAAAIDIAMLGDDDAAPLLSVRVEADWELPVAGKLRVAGAGEDSKPALHSKAPTPSLVFVSCGTMGDLESTVGTIVKLSPPLPAWEAYAPFADAALEYWLQVNAVRDGALDVLGDRSVTFLCPAIQPGTIPLPAIGIEAARLQGETRHPFEPFIASASAIEHEWSARQGLLAPIWGDALSIGLAERDGMWVAATTEPLMAEMMAHAGTEAADSDQHLVLEIDWAPVATAVRDLGTHWSELEVIPGASSRTFRDRLGRIASVLDQVGTTRVEGMFSGPALEFRGRLAGAPGPA